MTRGEGGFEPSEPAREDSRGSRQPPVPTASDGQKPDGHQDEADDQHSGSRAEVGVPPEPPFAGWLPLRHRCDVWYQPFRSLVTWATSYRRYSSLR